MKKMLFLMTMIAFVAIGHTTPASKPLSEATEKNFTSLLRKKVAMEKLSSNLHGLLNDHYRGKFTSVNDVPMIKRILKRAIRGDEGVLAQYFRGDIPNIDQTLLYQISELEQSVEENGLVSFAQADALIDRLQGRVVTNYYANGEWASASFGTDGSMSSWMPNRTELMLFLDGDENVPVFSGYCFNPIVPGNGQAEVSQEIPEQQGVVRRRTPTTTVVERGSEGVNIVITNTNTNTNEGSRGDGGTVQRGRGGELLAAGLGLAAGYLISRSTMNRGGYQNAGYYYQRAPVTTRTPPYFPDPPRFNTETLDPRIPVRR